MAPSPKVAYDRLLADIGRAGTKPWYPAEFLRANRLDPNALELAIDELRLAGLIELTPWEKDRGQGLRLTSNGDEVLLSPRWLGRLARGQLPTPADVRRHQDGPLDDATTFGRGEAIRAALLHPIRPRVTQILLGLNILVFLIGFGIERSAGGPMEQREIVAKYWTGAMYGPWLLEGQWWRLLSACFVHHGSMHLLINMIALWNIGPIQERLWGKPRFLAIYLLSGFGGSCAAMIWTPLSLVAGASGCIWGLLAAFLAWVLLNRAHLPRALVSDWGRQIGSALLLNAFISFLPGISAAGHFGGGAAGLVAAALLHFQRFTRGPRRWASLIAVALVPIVSFGLLLWAKDHTLRWNRVTKLYQAYKEHGVREMEREEK